MHTKRQHIHFMDLLRGVLMALGVLLHASQVFNPAKGWLIYSDISSHITQPLVAIIHVFRMPAFFIVAGFFALLTLKKYGPNKFLRLRAERVLVPLLATALIVNSIQTWILVQNGWTSFQLIPYLLQGGWITHLWFLIYLFLYLSLAYLGAFAARAPWLRFIKLKSSQHGIETMPLPLMLLALPAYQLLLLAAGKLFPEMYTKWLGTLSLFDFLYYFQFFAFGLLLHRYRSLFDSFVAFSVTKTGSVLSVLLLARIFADTTAGIAHALLHGYVTALTVWISCHVVFVIFKTFGDKPSSASKFTSSVSYTVYLFHHVFVVAFGLMLIRLGIGGTMGVILLAAIVLATGICIDLLFVSRYDWSSILFNGVRVKDRPYPGFTIGTVFRSNMANKRTLPEEKIVAGLPLSGSHGDHTA